MGTYDAGRGVETGHVGQAAVRERHLTVGARVAGRARARVAADASVVARRAVAARTVRGAEVKICQRE